MSASSFHTAAPAESLRRQMPVSFPAPFVKKADQPGPQAWLICNIKKFPLFIFGLRLPAAASCLGRHSHLAGRGPNSSFLFLPLAAVVAVAERTRRPF